jgi:hypothetical protein
MHVNGCAVGMLYTMMTASWAVVAGTRMAEVQSASMAAAAVVRSLAQSPSPA